MFRLSEKGLARLSWIWPVSMCEAGCEKATLGHKHLDRLPSKSDEKATGSVPTTTSNLIRQPNEPDSTNVSSKDNTDFRLEGG